MSPNVAFVHLPSIPLDYLEEAVGSKQKVDFSFTITMPLGILYLSSYAKAHADVGKIGLIDYPPRIADIHLHAGVDAFLTETARAHIDFEPDIIALSALFSSSHRLLIATVRALKTLWPKAVTIVGGVHATNCAEVLLAEPALDYVCRGEGEIAFAQFIDAFDGPGRDRIRGIVGKGHPAEAALAVCEMADDLDVLPPPDWRLLDMPYYTRETSRFLARNGGRFEDNPAAIIMTTRGCPFSCTFCASHTVHGRRLRFRSVENVLAEVRGLHRDFGVTTIIPEDDLFTGNRRKVLELLQAFQTIDIPNFELQFPNALSVNTLHDDVMDALIAAGMKVTNIAIESGSDEVQRTVIKKRVNLARAREVVQYFKDRGIIVRCFFILGFPGETRQQMQDSIDFARALGADWCFFGIAVPLIGSEMYQQLVNMDYIEDDVARWSHTIYGKRTFETREIAAAEIEVLAYQTNLDINFLNNRNLRSGEYERALEIFRDIIVKYPFHIFAEYCMALARRGMGNEAEAERHLARMGEMVASDRRAREMFEQYGTLLPDEVHARIARQAAAGGAEAAGNLLELAMERTQSLTSG